MRERTASRLVLLLGLLVLVTLVYTPPRIVVAAQLPPSWATVFFIDKASGTINLASLKTKLSTDGIAYTEPSGELPFYDGSTVYWKTYSSTVYFARALGGSYGSSWKQRTFATTESVVICFSFDYTATDYSYLFYGYGYATNKILAVTSTFGSYLRGSGDAPSPQYPMQDTLNYVFTNGGTSSSGTKTFASTYLNANGYLLLAETNDYGADASGSTSWVHWSFSGLTYTLKKAWLAGSAAGSNLECPEGTYYSSAVNAEITSQIVSDTSPRLYSRDPQAYNTAGGGTLAILIETSGTLSAPTYQFQDQSGNDWADEYYYAPCRAIGAGPNTFTFTVSGLPGQSASVSRGAYGKIYYDPFTSDTSGQYEAVSTASCAVTTSGGYFSGEGYLRVYTGDSPNSGGTGQACYARMQYKTSVSRGVVVAAYVQFDTDSGDSWAEFWYMGSGATGYKFAGKRNSDPVRIYKQTGESSYSELAGQGSSWNGAWSLVLFTADSSSVLRGYWQSINWEPTPTDSGYSSGKIGFGGRLDYNRWSHFVIMSSRSITVNGLQSGLTVDIYRGTTVAITGTATGSSLTLDTWTAMKSNYVPPYTKLVIRYGATVLYDSALAGQFANDIYGGDVYSYGAPANSVSLTVDGSPVGVIPPPYSKLYASGSSSSFSVPASKNCDGTMYYFQAWKNSAGQTISTDPAATVTNIQSSETYTAYYVQNVFVTATVTNFMYASSTARITSSTTSTALTSLFGTQTLSTTTTATAPQVTSTILFPTTVYSTTHTTASETSQTTSTMTTTTSYAGLSSTSTLLTTTGTTTITTGTSTTTSYATATTTTATSLSTGYATSAASTNTRTTTATTLTSTSYGYSATTIGTYATTTLTAVIGTTTTTAGNTIMIVYTERREVVTSYTESVRASKWEFGRLNIDTLITEISQLVETGYTSFLTSVQELWTDIVTFFETTVFGSTEETIVYAPMDVQMTIDSNPQGSGFVKVDGEPYTTPYTFTWKWGEIHQIEALSPVSGGAGTQYVFTSWNDGGGQIHVITVQDPMTITASYKTQYYLTTQVSPPSGGTVSPSSGWYDAGTPVEIQTTANEGYLFSGWLGVGEGSYSGPENPQTITMNGPITQTAQFGEWRVTITFALRDIDQVTGTIITIDSAPYSYTDFPKSFSWIVGTGHSVAATTPISAGSGKQYAFSSWTNGDGLSGSSGTYAVPTSDQIVTANYKTQYQLTIQVNNPVKGYTDPATGAYWYDSGYNQPVTAYPTSGNQLSHWELDGNNVGSSGTYTVLMDAPHTLKAIFEASEVAVTITSYPAGSGYIVVDGNPVSTPYLTSWQQRSTHTLQANTPVGDWRFKEWSDGNIQPERTVQVSGDSWSIQAIYSIQYQLTVSTNPSGVSPQPTVNPPGPWYDAGAVVTLTAQSVAGFDFRFWKVDGVSQGEGAAQIQVIMDRDHAAVAWYNFKPGEISRPAITFSATPPYLASLIAIITLGLAIAAKRRRPVKASIC